VRLFYALKIDLEELPEIKTSLRKLKKDAVSKDWECKFTPPENLHITISFLGEVEDRFVSRLSKVGKKVAESHPAFSLKISGFDAFPELQHARVIWAGVQNKKNLQAIFRDFETELFFLNRTQEQEYVPHLTLARLRNPHSVKNFLSPFIRKNFGAITCKEIGLYKSEQRGLYPHYELVESFPLAEVDVMNAASSSETPDLEDVF
jgi:2'-5' RNA ligase